MKHVVIVTLVALSLTSFAEAGPIRSAGKLIGKGATKIAQCPVVVVPAKGAVKVAKLVAKIF